MSEIKIIRHHFIDRLLHVLFGSVILLLLGTGLLPVLGVNFNWLVIHWVTGIVLFILVLFHLIRSVIFKSVRSMTFKKYDFSTTQKPGKYSLAQKMMHHLIALLTISGLITGGLMLVRIDTPFWQRNPFWLETSTWGLVYFIHGLVALAFVSTLMLHIYFALRPEKRLYLRAMKRGWISKKEYQEEHDSERWQIESEE